MKIVTKRKGRKMTRVKMTVETVKVVVEKRRKGGEEGKGEV